ncbi:MAG TPA: hypothetical protein VH637_17180 [Streptosporangiaceae bacterium]|jgi:hypothetical protein
MGEVGVDPESVAQAASALESLRDALAANVPTIVSNLSAYSAGVNTASLKQAQHQSVGDAADMRARARLAQLWEEQDVNVLQNGWVSIPWSGTDLDNADAQAEAAALSRAESGGDVTSSDATIKAIQQDIKDHMNDKAWLATFYNNAGPAVANLAATLNKNDVNPNDFRNRFTVLTKDDQQVLATFAAGLASADKSGSLTPDTVQAIANAKDIWSASMLIKYGPPGSSWATSEKPPGPGNPDGLSLLAVMTTNVWKDEQNGTIKIPLGGPHENYGYSDHDQLQDTLANYDPLSIMLKADAENKNAAWQVMGDTNRAYGNIGPDLAKVLLWNNGDLPSLDARFVRGGPDDHGNYPGFFTISPPGKAVDGDPSSIVLNFMDPKIAGSFLDAATSAPRGADVNAQYSAQAALTIIENTPKPDDGLGLDPAIQKALTDTAQRYMLDLAYSVNNNEPDGSGLVPPGSQTAPAWMFQVYGQGKDNPLSNFLQQIAVNKGDLAQLNAAAKVTFGNLYAQSQLHTLPSWLQTNKPDDSMARLLGRIDTEANNVGIDVLKDKDEQHEEYNKMLDFAENTVKFIPGVGEAADEAMDPVKSGLDLLGIPTGFSTDNAANGEIVATQDFADNSTQLHITMVQALMNHNAKDLVTSAQEFNKGLPPDQQFYQNGQLVVTKENYHAFNGWYNERADGMYNLDDLEAKYGFLYTQQGGTSSDGAAGPW